MRKTLLLCLVLLTTAAVVRADVKLPKVFGDHMVLQQAKAVPVWGWADAGEEVTVSFGEQKQMAKADDAGKWMVKLSEMPASAEPRDLTVTGKNTITFKDVLVGEVWVCSGQSNMEWPVSASVNPAEEVKNAGHPTIRLLTVTKARSADKKLEDITGAWTTCSPETISGFSAVAYFFGREISTQRKVPVGLIHTSWGGTPAEHWTPGSTFEADASLKQPGEHPHAKNVMKEPSVLYNAMIAPLVPYAIQGVIWYQGESNVPMAKEYRKLFPAMIEGWRKEWQQGDFPFLFVQIAPWKYDRIAGWPRAGCPLVREAQLQTLAAVKNTGMVVTMDIGDVNDIHPRNKQEVGRRLALCARKVAYGEELVYSGTLFKEQKTEGAKITVLFDHTAGELVAKGDKLVGWEIAGADKKFVPATAVIEGETVVVTAEGVAEPMFVRYGFADDALPNLANKEGLPASPFRTDGD